MKRFVKRRVRGIALLIFFTALLLIVERWLTVSLVRTSFVTGWALLGALVLLTCYTIQKRFSFLPIGSASFWLQIHIYVALLSFLLFLLHVQFRLPGGRFEVLLTAAYLGVFLSGVVGLVVSRTVPQRLTAHGEQILFERIPAIVRRLRMDVENLVSQPLGDDESRVISDFYAEHLEDFFAGPRNFWAHISHTMRPQHALLLNIKGMERFLNDREKAVMQEIESRVRIKSDLDYQYAWQAVLKQWLFVHVPLTYGLLALVLFHLLLVYSFVG